MRESLESAVRLHPPAARYKPNTTTTRMRSTGRDKNRWCVFVQRKLTENRSLNVSVCAERERDEGRAAAQHVFYYP